MKIRVSRIGGKLTLIVRTVRTDGAEYASLPMDEELAGIVAEVLGYTPRVGQTHVVYRD